MLVHERIQQRVANQRNKMLAVFTQSVQSCDIIPGMLWSWRNLWGVELPLVYHSFWKNHCNTLMSLHWQICADLHNQCLILIWCKKLDVSRAIDMQKKFSLEKSYHTINYQLKFTTVYYFWWLQDLLKCHSSHIMKGHQQLLPRVHILPGTRCGGK